MRTCIAVLCLLSMIARGVGGGDIGPMCGCEREEAPEPRCGVGCGCEGIDSGLDGVVGDAAGSAGGDDVQADGLTDRCTMRASSAD